MASSDLRKELDCPLCLSVCSDPVTLSCGHNYCRAYITPLLEHQAAPGVYSCPECREESAERPALIRNLPLSNIVRNLQTTYLDHSEPGKFCTYCSPSLLPAVKFCMDCKASLCDNHLKMHKSPKHVLSDLTPSKQSGICSIHDQPLEYYCQEDAAGLCSSCRGAEEHWGHSVESLDEAAEKKKEDLKSILKKMMTKKKETEDISQPLREHGRRIKKKIDGEAERVKTIFIDLKRQLGDLEKKILREIYRQAEWDKISNKMKQLDEKMEELFQKMGHIKKLCHTTDPLTVLQDPHLGDLEVESGDILKKMDEESGDILKKMNEVKSMSTSGKGNAQGGGDLNVDNISHTLQTISDVIMGVNVCFYMQEGDKLSLNPDTANWALDVHDKTASWKQNARTIKPESFKEVPQVMTMESFSSGRHYWEASMNSSDWCIGVCYPSMDRIGNQSRIGNNTKSWGLYKWFDQYSVIHDRKAVQLPIKLFSYRVRVYLDYEAGQISLYDLSDPIRHIHTFTATFTEPLHAVLAMWQRDGGSITLSG